MVESNENILRAIKHYQESLDKYSARKNNVKLLHSLEKLYKLPIKVAHLEETGVGRTVNALRKIGGDVGDAAKSLVAKWKVMVVQEESNSDPDVQAESQRVDSSQHPDTPETSDSAESPDTTYCENVEEKENKHSSKHRSSPHSSRERDRKDYNKKHKSEKRKHESDTSDCDDDSKKRKRSDSLSDKERSNKRESGSDEESSSRHKSKKSRHRKHESADDTTSAEEMRHKSKKSKHTRHESDSESRKSKQKDSKRKSEKSCDIEESNSRHKHESDSDKKAKKHRKDDMENDNKKQVKHSKEDSRQKHKKESPKTDSKHTKDEKKGDDSNKHERKGKKDRSKSETPSNKSRSNLTASDKSDKKAKASTSSKIFVNGIDSGSGASFAEALGMCAPSIKIPITSSSTSKKKSTPNPTNEKSSSSKEKSPPVAGSSSSSIPKLLKTPTLEPLDINLSTLLPPITPHYRPLGNNPYDSHKRVLTDDEALSQSITSKNQRTKVYSGNKTGSGKVPSLFEMCTRILQDNIDALEYTGGVPYSILKPILEKATAHQLYTMEHHNPYLVEDSDELWQLHCQREFRNKKREEMESWRDTYLRCTDEREAKLQALTENIKQAQVKTVPVRTTKLAYVNDIVKPPREIARRQAKNGTTFDKKPAQTPSSRLTAIATSGEAGKVAVPNPGSRAAERSSAGYSHAAKPKKAPLMAKTLSFFKKGFRR